MILNFIATEVRQAAWAAFWLMWISVIPMVVSAAEQTDFSEGVERLIALGLPDTKSAKYVKVEGGYWGGGMMERLREAKVSGNGWLVAEQPGTNGTLVVNGFETTVFWDPKIIEERQKKMMEEAAKNPQQPRRLAGTQQDWQSGKWQAADLQKDCDAVLEYLRKEAKDSSIQYGGGQGVLLFALHAHRNGQAEKANEIIERLFEKAGDRRKLLRQVMNQLADTQYKKVYQGFTESGDWKQYLSGMEQVYARFPKVWQRGPAAQIISDAVRKHIELKGPPPVTGEGVTPEDQKLALALANSPQPVEASPMGMIGGGLWVLGEDTDALEFDPSFMAGEYGELFITESFEEVVEIDETATETTPPETKPVLEQIKQRKVKALPLLIALLRDTYLVRTHSSYESHQRSFGIDMEENEEMAQMMLDSTQRPLSRGEIARMLLEPLMLKETERYDRENKVSVDEIEKRARAWYAEHKDKTRTELLHYYLAKGQRNEQQEALRHLMKSKAPADRQAVEQFLLQPDSLVRNLRFVSEYARQTGAESKAFVAQYLAKVKALPSLLDPEETRHMGAAGKKQREQQMRAQLQALEDTQSEKTAATVIKELLAADKSWDPVSWNQASTVLWSKLEKETPEAALTLVLEAALQTTNTFIAQNLVSSVPRLNNAAIRKSTGNISAPAPPKKLDPALHAALWKQLIQLDRALPSDGYGGGKSVSLGQLAASVVDRFYATSPTGAPRYEIMRMLGTRLYEVYRARAEARLAGTKEPELPAFPDAAKVSAARKEELKRELGAATPENQANVSARLNLDEVLALSEVINSDEQLNRKLARGSQVVQRTSLETTNQALRGLVESMKGKPVDRKTAEALLEACKAELKTGNNLTIKIAREPALGGVYVTVGPTIKGRSGFGSYSSSSGRSKAIGWLIATISAQGQESLHHQATWTVEIARPKSSVNNAQDEDLLASAMQEMSNSDYMVKQQEEYWETFDKLFDPKRSVLEPYECAFMGRQPEMNEE